MLIAALDANVLVPIVACDFLLTAFDHGVYEPIVSLAALDEVARAHGEDFPQLDRTAIDRRVAFMRVVLADQTVDAAQTDLPDTINAKDRHIVGAALAAQAAIIVTNDRRLREEVETGGLGPRAVELDTFASELWRSSPAGITAVVDALVRKRRRRPVTRAEIVESIRKHMPTLAERLTAG